jgi:hypothetical protein
MRSSPFRLLVSGMAALSMVSVAACSDSTTEPSSSSTDYRDDSRCSDEAMLTQEVKWMDDGTIPDNAENESSLEVVQKLDDAKAAGGTCDEVLDRFLASLS